MMINNMLELPNKIEELDSYKELKDKLNYLGIEISGNAIAQNFQLRYMYLTDYVNSGKTVKDIIKLRSLIKKLQAIVEEISKSKEFNLIDVTRSTYCTTAIKIPDDIQQENNLPEVISIHDIIKLESEILDYISAEEYLECIVDFYDIMVKALVDIIDDYNSKNKIVKTNLLDFTKAQMSITLKINKYVADIPELIKINENPAHNKQAVEFKHKEGSQFAITSVITFFVIMIAIYRLTMKYLTVGKFNFILTKMNIPIWEVEFAYLAIVALILLISATIYTAIVFKIYSIHNYKQFGIVKTFKLTDKEVLDDITALANKYKKELNEKR